MLDFFQEKPKKRWDYQVIDCDVADIIYLCIPTMHTKANLKNGALNYHHAGRNEGLNTLARHMELGYQVLTSQRYQTPTEQGFEMILIRKK